MVVFPPLVGLSWAFCAGASWTPMKRRKSCHGPCPNFFVALNLNHIPYIPKLRAFKVVCYIVFYRGFNLSYIYIPFFELSEPRRIQPMPGGKPRHPSDVGWTMCRFYGAVFYHMPSTVCHQVCHKQSAATSRKSNEIQTCFKVFC